MSRILFLNPNKWGRGITSLWIPSHAGILNKHHHQVKLFDASFYKDWSVNEVQIQTQNQNYKKSDYDSSIKYNTRNIKEDLQKQIDNFKPHIIFWSAISSHIR